ncbi:MAG: isoprenylcysteine carboxylmethyltransferase family protein [Xanthobacteraceae bacterium]
MAQSPAKPKRNPVLRWLKSTSNRTYVLYPVLIAAFEYVWNGGVIYFQPLGLILLVWGYGQYRLVGNYRERLGGGGPGFDVPPDRIVDHGPYAYTRNPMYLGHLIFMLGLAVTFWSWAALLLLGFHVVWFQRRVLEDEARLRQMFGAQYEDYHRRVKRWIPYVY